MADEHHQPYTLKFRPTMRQKLRTAGLRPDLVRFNGKGGSEGNWLNVDGAITGGESPPTFQLC